MKKIKSYTSVCNQCNKVFEHIGYGEISGIYKLDKLTYCEECLIKIFEKIKTFDIMEIKEN